jgi:selenide,water dikinase
VRGEELFYGLSVTGRVNPRKVVRNVGARPGDAMVLTKPIGSGLIINGLRKRAIDEERARPILSVLARLNRTAAEVMARFDVHAATDITGFGLVGHTLSMAIGSGVGISLWCDKLPQYPHVREMVHAGVTTGSTKPNRAWAAPRLRATLDKFWDELVHDPQTSGGLLMAVEGAQAGALVEELHRAGVEHACLIGEVKQAEEAYLELR